MTNPSGLTLSVLRNFEGFYADWLVRQETILDKLYLTESLQAKDKDTKREILIKQVLEHYQQYYEEKSKATVEDVFVVLSAPWLSTYERTLLWLSGTKPSILFRLLAAAVVDLSDTQDLGLQEVKAEIRSKEKELTEAMACLQETVAAPPMLEPTRRAGRLLDGEIAYMDDVIEELKIAMQRVLERADLLRGWTMMRVKEILNLEQTIKLLTAAAEFQLRTRRWGVERDLQRITPRFI